jgi:hypothetical protein
MSGFEVFSEVSDASFFSINNIINIHLYPKKHGFLVGLGHAKMGFLGIFGFFGSSLGKIFRLGCLGQCFDDFWVGVWVSQLNPKFNYSFGYKCMII